MSIIGTERGIKTSITIGDIEVGGQENAKMYKTIQQSDITNMIKMDWKRTITSIKGWSVVCSGLVIKSDEGFKALRNAYENNSLVKIKVEEGTISEAGYAYITSFPVTSTYNSGWTYSVTFEGSGALTLL